MKTAWSQSMLRFYQRELKGLHGKARRDASSAARRKAFQAAGLRSDGKKKVGRKPCGCLFGSCLKCAKTDNALIIKPALVATMWADYEAGMSLACVARKYDRNRKSLNEIFERRGYKLRPLTTKRPEFDPVTGRIKAMVPKTWPEIRVICERAAQRKGKWVKTINCPKELALQWRKADMPWRRKLIALMRSFVENKNARPTTPFSQNVTPFEYGTPEAMAVMKQMNAGLASRHFKCRIWTTSTGVIHEETLYFWTGHATREHESTGYLTGTYPRRLLHHVLWERANWRPVPAKHTVIFTDGNKNNFLPRNLALRSMAACALMNSVLMRLKNDPHNPELLKKLKLRGERAWRTRTINGARRARKQVGVLLKNFQTGGGDLLSALNQRSK